MENQQLREVAMMLQMAVSSLSLVSTSLGTSEKQSKDVAAQYTKLLGDMQAALSNLGNIQKFDEVLQNMSDTLTTLKDVERPQFPDYASPVVEQIGRLEDSLTKVIQGLNTSPNIKVASPQVHVPTPQVKVAAPDLKGLEKSLSAQLGKLQAALKPEKLDLSTVTQRLDSAIAMLQDIDTGVRLKPQFPTDQLNKIAAAQETPWRYVDLVQTSTVDTWTFRQGDAKSAITRRLTITYTDSTKGTISTVVSGV